MRSHHRFAVPVVGLAVMLVCSLAVSVPVAEAKSQVTQTGKPKPHNPPHHHAPPAPDHYLPPKGVRFNEPYNRVHPSYNIRRHILRTIDSMRPGTKIRISAWNVHSYYYTHALILAHQRGVSVRVIMDHANAFAGYPNPDVNRLQAALKVGDGKRSPGMTSWLKKCYASCRGRGGIPHSKFFLFDRVGGRGNHGAKSTGVKYVTMYGSNNATDLAANVQWNDLFTFVGHPSVYNEFIQIFHSMSQDKKVPGGAFREFEHNGFNLYFYPYTGAEADQLGDPDLRFLNNVRCTGATGHSGNHGHTIVRMAQDAILGDRGIAIAHRIATMEKRGCDIRIVYSLLGGNVIKVLRAAHVPLMHLAYDANDDGLYDHYLHMKAMAISGVYKGDTSAHVTINGSANWSPVALASDEIVGELFRPKVTSQYISWINWLFTHRPSWWLPDQANVTARRVGPDGHLVDPYKLIREDP
jgi:phosphatidylserine/phosphatidylglycerophosphate/cardiolipin synthase-like enzyme